MFSALQRLSLFLVGISLPMQGYSFLDFSFGLTPFKLATALLLAVGFVKLGITGSALPPDRKRLWMLAFLTSFLISCVAGFLGGTSLLSLFVVSSTYVSLVLYYFLIGYLVTSQRDLVLLLWALLIGGALTSAPAFLGMQQGADIGYGERFTGLSGQANLLGFDMAICFPIGVALFFVAKTNLRRGLALGLAAACLVGLFMSLSRSAFVSLATMGVYWVWRAGVAGSIKYVVPALAFMIGLVLLAPEAAVERMDSVINPNRRAEDGSVRSRVGQIPFALQAVASSPVVGIGVLRFVPWAQEQRGGFGQAHEVHNAYLGVAVEQGFLGLVPYLALLALTWGDFARCLREVRARGRLRDPALAELTQLVLFMQIALLGSLVGGVFGMAQKSKTTWLLMALSPVVLALGRERIRELEPEREGPARPQPRFASAPRISLDSPAGG